MLLKRLSAIAAVFFLLTAFSSPVYADTSSIASSTAIATAEQAGIPATNLNGDSLQYISPPTELQIMPGMDYGYLAYGSPFDPNSNGVDRYIGYNQYGEAIDNVAFPPDADPDGANFEDEDWVSQPWLNPQVQNDFGVSNEGGWDGSTQYQDSIMAGVYWLNTTTGVGGIGSSTGYTITDWDSNSLWANLYQYVNIVMPPTEYTWGMGRMWHSVNGSLWYVTIPLPPLVVVDTPVLTVTPPSATINVGGTQQFDGICYDNGQVNDVTTQSAWSSSSTSVATIGANMGDAQGASAGTTNIVATYTTPEGTTLTGTATLTVQAQQQPGNSQTGGNNSPGNNSPPGGNNPSGGNNPTGQVSGALSFTAVSQAGTVRPADTAEWTDMVTASLTSDAPPQPTASSPNYITGWTWSISNVTLSYPTQAQPGSNGAGGFSFGYAVDPPGQMENGVYVATTMTPVSMATQSSSTANASFRETWSLDGAGNGRGIYSIIKNPPGIMAATATPFDITAAWTVQSNWTLMVYEGKNMNGSPIFSTETESQNYTGACDGVLTVDGSGVNSLGNNNNGN
jgi:hypothetical protein